MNAIGFDVARGLADGDGRTAGDVDHQSVSSSRPVSSGAFWPKNFSNTLSAAGAAAVEPCPPFSIRAQTTSLAFSDGPQPHHHDWSSRWSDG